MNKFCAKCGAPLAPGATVCGKCGAQIKSDVPTPAKSSSSSLHPLALGILISAVAVILATFLPYVSVSFLGFSQSASVIVGGDGLIFIATAAMAIVGALLKKPLIALIGGIITVGLCIFELVNASSELGGYASYIDKGAGYYLLLIASIALVIFCVLSFLASRKSE